ncbi:hypothetical protein PanWU01x14_026480, partial [Parasponia andersonii]
VVALRFLCQKVSSSTTNFTDGFSFMPRLEITPKSGEYQNRTLSLDLFVSTAVNHHHDL